MVGSLEIVVQLIVSTYCLFQDDACILIQYETNGWIDEWMVTGMRVSEWSRDDWRFLMRVAPELSTVGGWMGMWID